MKQASDKLKEPVPALKVKLFRDAGQTDPEPWCINLVLETARQLSEGEVRSEPLDQQTFFGSTMITCDLLDLSGRIREKITPSLARSLSIALSGSPLFHTRVLRMARLDAEQKIGSSLPGRLPENAEGEVKIHAAGTSLLIDVDIECHLAKSHLPSNTTE